jgi:hypothetical protein
LILVTTEATLQTMLGWQKRKVHAMSAPRNAALETTTPPSPADVPESVVTLLDGSDVAIRTLHREDAELDRAFIRNLSPESRWMRFLGQIGEPSDSPIRKLTELDYRHDMAFIALSRGGGIEHAVGVSRYSLTPDGQSCECAVAVADAWQGMAWAPS